MVGGIAGVTRDTKVENCQYYGNVYGSWNVGGLIGRAFGDKNSSSLTKCLAIGKITSDGRCGGIVGDAVETTIQSSFYEGDIVSKDSSNSGLIVGGGTNSKVKDCLAFTKNETAFVGRGISCESSLYEIGTNKYFYNGDFLNWVILTTNKPLPKDLCWIGIVGEKVSLSQIQSLGYVL